MSPLPPSPPPARKGREGARGRGEGEVINVRPNLEVAAFEEPALTPSPSPIRWERVAGRPGEGWAYSRFMVPTRDSGIVEALAPRRPFDRVPIRGLGAVPAAGRVARARRHRPVQRHVPVFPVSDRRPGHRAVCAALPGDWLERRRAGVR